MKQLSDFIKYYILIAFFLQLLNLYASAGELIWPTDCLPSDCIGVSAYSDTENDAKAQDWQNIRINEIMAEDGDYADWIEIYNSGDQPVLLEGLYLTDDLTDPTKWEIPYDLVIQPKGFEVFWADGMDAGRHTNFKLKQKGEDVGLFDPDGNLIDSVVYGRQIADVSFGRQPDGSSAWLFFGEPSPGTENNRKGCQDNIPGYLLPEPQFSLKGGFYSGSQTVSLSSNFSRSEAPLPTSFPRSAWECSQDAPRPAMLGHPRRSERPNH
ncbi:MAG: lamin tail domain-containing protein, partial [Desulfobacterales bacterium]|nr:lamin tail domain-containing protein [Desulfobacterales bacterium]